VEHADISDIIAGRHELEALKVLEIVCEGLSGRQLRSIDLSDNALGEKGINACRAILEGQDQLASIYVNNNGLSAAAAHVSGGGGVECVCVGGR
jgi:Ran GTPase-activating protein 1